MSPATRSFTTTGGIDPVEKRGSNLTGVCPTHATNDQNTFSHTAINKLDAGNSPEPSYSESIADGVLEKDGEVSSTNKLPARQSGAAVLVSGSSSSNDWTRAYPTHCPGPGRHRELLGFMSAASSLTSDSRHTTGELRCSCPFRHPHTDNSLERVREITLPNEARHSPSPATAPESKSAPGPSTKED